MGGSSTGKIFRLTTYGESHGSTMGAIIDGCPAGLSISEQFINAQLARRRPGQSDLTTARREADKIQLLSGIFQGKSTGTPIALSIRNKDVRSSDYEHLRHSYRPSHADFSYDAKYARRDYRGGGRASARETAMWVAAGAIARQLLASAGIHTWAYVSQVGHIHAAGDYHSYSADQVDANAVRCPDTAAARQMEALIREVQAEGDTVGGVITGIVEGVPPGLGEPVFDKLHADLAKAMLSINACKGFEYGSGFAGSQMRGSQHNDLFLPAHAGRVSTATNFSGGIQGGISNGMDIYFRVAFKPIATLMQDQISVDDQGRAVTIAGKGRHDPCVLPRAVPIVEAMAALVMADHWLRQRSARL